MPHPKVPVQTLISADISKVWEFYTQPEHITQWIFAHPMWHCPKVSNDLRVGGKYFARMESGDGSFGFDFESVYLEVKENEGYTYVFGGRQAQVEVQELDGKTELRVTFDPETELPIDLQRDR